MHAKIKKVKSGLEKVEHGVEKLMKADVKMGKKMASCKKSMKKKGK